MAERFLELKEEFILNFIDDARWKLLVDGLWNTLKITFFALLMGLVIGVVVASIRSTLSATLMSRSAMMMT